MNGPSGFEITFMEKKSVIDWSDAGRENAPKSVSNIFPSLIIYIVSRILILFEMNWISPESLLLHRRMKTIW